MRRSRTEHLFLVAADGTRTELATQTRERGELTTQDVFQVSPDGAYLAYAVDHRLYLRAADGKERMFPEYAALMRFAPDGKSLAATFGKDEQRVVVIDLASKQTRELGTLAGARQIEWVQGGLVASTWRGELLSFPLEGASKKLAVPHVEKFVAAATRVVFFEWREDGTHVTSLDLASSATRELRVVKDEVTNAALSLDGSRLAFTTALAVYTSTGDARPETISDRSGVHSLWFAADGRLGYASSTSATILDGGRSHRFDVDGPIQMLRFDPLTKRALVATATHAWDAMGSGRIAAEPELLGVDHFAGGLVLWTGHTDTRYGW